MEDSTLKRLQESLLLILDEIDRICRKHHIPYFLDSGTALGAVRHGGFIPWDDDADVGLLRANYERFLRAAEKELSPAFFLQTMDTEPEYTKFSAKIRLNHTFFPEKREADSRIHHGIFVDIFPFDYISEDPNEAKKEIRKMRVLNRLYSLRVRHPKEEGVFRKAGRACVQIVPKAALAALCDRHIRKHDRRPTSKVTCFPYKMNNAMFLWFDAADLAETMDISFEGRRYAIMKNAHAYLTRMYGDYMKLPPEESRVWHFEGEVRFE